MVDIPDWQWTSHAYSCNFRNLHEIIGQVADVLSMGTADAPVKVLLYCRAGIRGSATLAAAFMALMTFERPGPNEHDAVDQVGHIS